MELLPIVLVGLTIAKLVGAGQPWIWAIFVTGAALLVVTLITMITVKETPLTEKPTTPFWPPMLRVLGMLGGMLAGGLAGVLGGGLVGGSGWADHLAAGGQIPSPGGGHRRGRG